MKGVPVEKYRFSEHLLKVGDWVESDAIPFEERDKIKKAAHFWAYKHRCTVKTTTLRKYGGKVIRVEVIKAYR